MKVNQLDSHENLYSQRAFLRWLCVFGGASLLPMGFVVHRNAVAADKDRAQSSPLVQLSKDAASLTTGKIAFSSSRDRKNADDVNFEVYIMNSDGSNESRLTFSPEFDGDPTFGNTGQNILFDSVRNDYNRDVYVMAVDGTKVKRLTVSPSLDASPAVSPDGRIISWVSDGSNRGRLNIYTMNAEGGNTRQITQKGGDDPTFSPDGRRIAYWGDPPRNADSYRGYQPAMGMIYTINLDGTDQKVVRTGMNPQYSPDGKRLIFSLSSSGGSRIGTVNIDGIGTRWLSPQGVHDRNPTWSPDGKWVAFDSAPALRSARSAYFSETARLNGDDNKRDIYVMRNDGSQVIRLTQSLDGVGTNFRPRWGTNLEGNIALRELPSMPIPRLTAPKVSTAGSGLTQNIANGQLIYAANELQDAPFPSSLVLQDVRTVNRASQAQLTVKSYRIQSVEGRYGPLLFDPQFSPSGQQVTAKLGTPSAEFSSLEHSPFSSYNLYAWNLQEKQWRQVSQRKLYYPHALWSPDEKHIATIAGGASVGIAPGSLVGSYLREGYMIYPDVPNWAEPLSLYVNDIHDGYERLIVKNSTIAYNVCWADKETLLYAMLTPGQQKQWQQQHPVPKKGETAIRPNIYEYSLQTRQQRLLIKDGHRPSVSPDGKWIAFFGSSKKDQPYPLNEDWWLRPSWSSLIVAHRDGTKRTPLKKFEGSYPSVIWKGDGQNLITLHQAEYGVKARAEVEQWNFVTGAWHRIATLQTSDTTGTRRSARNPQFEALKLSKDSRFLLVRVVENSISATPTTQPTQITYLRAVELKTGEVTTIARVEGCNGLDWQEGM